jgi:trehalose 6-phosphate synthase
VPGLQDLVVVANRLPVNAVTDDDGVTTWTRSPGGLVSSLEPILRDADAVWVGWSGRPARSPDVQDVDLSAEGAADEAPLPESLGSLTLHEVRLTEGDIDLYYEGFSNSALWPLYHDGIAVPSYHRHQWNAYEDVNRRFAETVAELAAPGATVWVHDYQLQLVPRLLRVLRPDVRIGFFLHIPFPPPELFRQLPWRTEILDGLLGADLVGLQTRGDAENLFEAAASYADVTIHGGRLTVDDPTLGHRHVQVDAFPISIDTAEIDAIARTPQVHERALEIRRSLGEPRRVLLGIDRLDYTKGIDVRINAVAELFTEGELSADDTVFVQIATPSRENVDDYQRARDEIALMVGRAMGDHGMLGAQPIQYVHQPLEREHVVAFYLAADVMLVTPYRDGMNLVAKEYVASRYAFDGALVLSEFAGAAEELVDAFLVNPFDADGIKESILEAVHAAPDDLNRRMTSMRALLFEHDGTAWAHRFIDRLTSEAAE